MMVLLVFLCFFGCCRRPCSCCHKFCRCCCCSRCRCCGHCRRDGYCLRSESIIVYTKRAPNPPHPCSLLAAVTYFCENFVSVFCTINRVLGNEHLTCCFDLCGGRLLLSKIGIAGQSDSRLDSQFPAWTVGLWNCPSVGSTVSRLIDQCAAWTVGWWDSRSVGRSVRGLDRRLVGQSLGRAVRGLNHRLVVQPVSRLVCGLGRRLVGWTVGRLDGQLVVWYVGQFVV